MELDQWRFVVELCTLAIAVVGVGFGLWQLGQATKHRKLELGSLYIQRFWQIDDDLLRSATGSSEHNQARHRYVRLCEDEFEAARRGWLELGQWRAWHEWLTDPRQQGSLLRTWRFAIRALNDSSISAVAWTPDRDTAGGNAAHRDEGSPVWRLPEAQSLEKVKHIL